jgi:hypothetical protein
MHWLHSIKFNLKQTMPVCPGYTLYISTYSIYKPVCPGSSSSSSNGAPAHVGPWPPLYEVP